MNKVFLVFAWYSDMQAVAEEKNMHGTFFHLQEAIDYRDKLVKDNAAFGDNAPLETEIVRYERKTR